MPRSMQPAIAMAAEGKGSHAEIATRAHFHQTTISRWIREGIPDLEDGLEKLAAFERAVGVPEGFVLAVSGYTSPTATRDVIAVDTRLGPVQRRLLLAVYDGFVADAERERQEAAQARRRGRPPKGAPPPT